MPKVDLSVNLAGMTMKNPIVVASGTFGFGREYNQFFDLGELGGICAKGLTLHRTAAGAGCSLGTGRIQPPVTGSGCANRLTFGADLWGFTADFRPLMLTGTGGQCKKQYQNKNKHTQSPLHRISLLK